MLKNTLKVDFYVKAQKNKKLILVLNLILEVFNTLIVKKNQTNLMYQFLQYMYIRKTFKYFDICA